ncbi:MAG: hypothetical protein LBK82_10925 [Planctomycetaceae bacterium]|jgi:hypothetical protein|nr:hypothetical protein [Planctomycetaceae bacterium]
MPFQPGILFSVFLLILCLGINLTYYPQVRGTFYESGKEVTAVSSEPPVLKSDKTDSMRLPSLPQNQNGKENFSPPSVPAIPVKTSKVNKPIQPDLLQEPPKEKEKNSQTFEKKPDAFLMESKPDKPKATVKESEKNEKPKQPEPKQPEPKQSKPKQLEPKQPEPKQSAYSAPTVLPLPSSKTTYPEWEDTKNSITSEQLPPVSNNIATKTTENIIQKKSASNSETAFLPIVPPSLEKEYWQSDGQNNNQLAIFAPQKTVPMLNVPVAQPSQPTPAYANAYQEPKQVVPSPQDKTNPVEKNKPKPPTIIWETIDSALERPLMYENP